MGQRDGTPRPIVEDREGGDRATSQQNIDNREDHRVGIKTGETGELQVRLLQENAVPPVRGSARATGYDLCAASDCVTPGGKGIVEIGLAVSLPPGTYARMAPHSGLAIRNFIDVGAGVVVDSDYWGETKVVLFNHSTEEFPVRNR